MTKGKVIFLVNLFGAVLYWCALCSELKESREFFYDNSDNDTNYGESASIGSSTAARKITFNLAPLCSTPNRDTGYCIEIGKCSILLDQLRNTGAYDFLRASQCGFSDEDSRHPKVCCGRYGNYRRLLEIPTVCTTPNGDVGHCKKIQSCPVLANQLSNSRAFAFLRESRCGTSVENPGSPKVCCGRYDNFKRSPAPNPLPKRCGIQNITFSLPFRIFGGEEADIGEFPWMAKVVHTDPLGYKTFGCSAFLIHAKHLLTAAHCIESEEWESLGKPSEVVLGEHDTENEEDCTLDRSVCSEPPQWIRIREIVVHPRYDKLSRDQHNDIAIIHLRTAATFSNFVQPICLLDSTYNDATEYWLSGWGETEYSLSSPVKLKAAVPTASYQDCRDLYSDSQINIDRTQMCAGGTDKDSCKGDSGGPLMVQKNVTHWYAAGIVSYGIGCAKPGWPAVYTNIPSFLSWIKREILRSAEQPGIIRRPRPESN